MTPPNNYINLPVIFKLILPFIESLLSLLCSLVKVNTVLPIPIIHEYNLKHSHTYLWVQQLPLLSSCHKYVPKWNTYILSYQPLIQKNKFDDTLIMTSFRTLMLRQNYVNMLGWHTTNIEYWCCIKLIYNWDNYIYIHVLERTWTIWRCTLFWLWCISEVRHRPMFVNTFKKNNWHFLLKVLANACRYGSFMLFQKIHICVLIWS